MLGKVAEKQFVPFKVKEITTRLRDAILAHWKRESDKKIVNKDFKFRSSSVYELCPRMYALACRDNAPIKKKPFGAELLFRFATGTSYHDSMQREALLYLNEKGDVFRGHWEKREMVEEQAEVKQIDGDGIACEETTRSERVLVRKGLNNKAIPKPSSGWKFVEIAGSIPELRLSGHWDGELVWGDAPDELLELKTIAQEQADSVRPQLGGKPLANHIKQSHCYMKMAGLSRARIVYMVKGQISIKATFYEHIVEWDQHIWDEIEKELKACVDGVDRMEAAKIEAAKVLIDEDDKEQKAAYQKILDDALPERCPECTRRTDKRAKNCPGKEQCLPKRAARKKKA